MKTMASIKLSDKWSLVLLFREDEQEFPFIITAWDNEKNQSFWDMYFDEPSQEHIGMVYHKESDQQGLIHSLNQMAFVTKQLINFK